MAYNPYDSAVSAFLDAFKVGASIAEGMEEREASEEFGASTGKLAEIRAGVRNGTLDYSDEIKAQEAELFGRATTAAARGNITAAQLEQAVEPLNETYKQRTFDAAKTALASWGSPEALDAAKAIMGFGGTEGAVDYDDAGNIVFMPAGAKSKEDAQVFSREDVESMTPYLDPEMSGTNLLSNQRQVAEANARMANQARDDDRAERQLALTAATNAGNLDARLRGQDMTQERYAAGEKRREETDAIRRSRERREQVRFARDMRKPAGKVAGVHKDVTEYFSNAGLRPRTVRQKMPELWDRVSTVLQRNAGPDAEISEEQIAKVVGDTFFGYSSELGKHGRPNGWADTYLLIQQQLAAKSEPQATAPQ